MVEGGVGHPVAFDAGGKLDEYRMRQSWAQEIHRSRACLPSSPLTGKHMPQALFEQVGAIQTGIGLMIQASLASHVSARSSGPSTA